MLNEGTKQVDKQLANRICDCNGEFIGNPREGREPKAREQQKNNEQADHNLALIFHQAKIGFRGKESQRNTRAVKRRDGNEVKRHKQEIVKCREAKQIASVTQTSEYKLGNTRISEVCLQCNKKSVQSRADETHNSICQRTCKGGERHAALGIAEVACVDRHGLCPTESKHEHTQKSHWVNVFERIEGQTPEIVSGVVTAFVCHVSVCGLVQGERQHNDGHTEDEGYDNIGDITAG